MHDLLQYIGRKIAMKTQLWDQKKANDFLMNNKLSPIFFNLSLDFIC